MALFKGKIFGKMRGKIGGMVLYERKGVVVGRSLPDIKKPRSKAQLAQQQKMTMISPILNAASDFIKVGFAGIAKKDKNPTANNFAKSYNLSAAIKGIYPEQEIDYPSVLLTNGTLDPAYLPTAVVEGKGIRFRWAIDPAGKNYNQKDIVMVLVYSPELRRAEFSLSGNRRASLMEELLPLNPYKWKGMKLYAYISFVKSDLKEISKSVFVGELVF